MSFWIFFLLMTVLTIDIPICISTNWTFVEPYSLLSTNNIIALICICLLILGMLFYYQFNNGLKGDLNLPVKVVFIENINYEYFALLVTIISLIAFDFSTIRGFVFFILLMIILCAIFIKTELFYSNPSFALLGFHIYKADTNNENLKGAIFISKDKIKKDDKIKYLRISDKVYFTKKA